MEGKNKIILAASIVLLMTDINCANIEQKNKILGNNIGVSAETSSESASSLKKIPLEIFDADKGKEKPQYEEEQEERVMEEVGEEEDGKEGAENFLKTELDEETIRKAEKIADEDLLNGLNRILENNETLQDVFRAENINEFF